MNQISSRDILILLLIISSFFFFLLGTRALNVPDEGRYSEVVREMVVSKDYITPNVNGLVFLDKPVLFFWLASAAVKLAGFSEWAYRAVPAIFGILGCLLVFITAHTLYDRRTAWLAAFILATIPFYFFLARYANLDITVAILIEAALFLFLLAVNTNNTKQQKYIFWMAYVFAAFATLTKGLIGIVFPLMIIGAWITILDQWHIVKKMHLPSGLFIYFLIVTPWYVLVQKANPDFFHYFFVHEHFMRFSQTGFNNPSPWWFYLAVLVPGAFPWVLHMLTSFKSYFCRDYWQERIHYKNEFFFLLNTVLILIFFSIPRSKPLSYILPVFPPISILIAHNIIKNFASHKRLLIGSLILFALLSPVPLFLGLKRIDHVLSISTVEIMLATISAWVIFVILIPRYVKRNEIPWGSFLPYLFTLVAWLMLLTIISGEYPVDSQKEIGLTVKSLLKPTDKVMMFSDYFDDLPVYLQQQVILVDDWDPKTTHSDGWKIHFIYASQHQETTQLVWKKDLLKAWDSPQNYYLFISKDKLPELTALIKKPLDLVTENKNTAVFVNHKIKRPH